MTNRPLLQVALSSNAGFSAASGLVLAVLPGAIGDAIGVGSSWLLRIFGLALLGHAIALCTAIPQAAIERWAKLNLWMIAPYPFAMLLVAATIVDGGSGRALVLADGTAIALIAAANAAGLRRATSVA